MIFKRELAVEKFSYTKVLDMAVYINLPLLAILMFLVISIFGNTPPYWFTYIFNTSINKKIDEKIFKLPTND